MPLNRRRHPGAKAALEAVTHVGFLDVLAYAREPSRRTGQGLAPFVIGTDPDHGQPHTDQGADFLHLMFAALHIGLSEKRADAIDGD